MRFKTPKTLRAEQPIPSGVTAPRPVITTLLMTLFEVYDWHMHCSRGRESRNEKGMCNRTGSVKRFSAPFEVDVAQRYSELREHAILSAMLLYLNIISKLRCLVGLGAILLVMPVERNFRDHVNTTLVRRQVLAQTYIHYS